ncbi:cation:proton antiporter [Trichothermofontia sp.]
MVDFLPGAYGFPALPLSTWIPGAVLATSSNSEPIDSTLVLAGVLLSLVIIYLASKVGGELANRFALPPVLGELIAGVVVGVAGLKLIIVPESGLPGTESLVIQFLQLTSDLTLGQAEATFEAQSEVISVLAELGVIILLFEIGLESNIKDLLEVGIQAFIVAVMGVIVPFVAGTAGLMLLFRVAAVPAIFAGAALTATSIGITSRVLAELPRPGGERGSQLASIEGQIILGAAVIDDVLGIIVLAVVASLAKTSEVDPLSSVYLLLSALLFLVGAILLGNFLSKTFIALSKRLQTRGELVIPALTFAFILAYVAAAVHLEAILGAFAAGLLFDESHERLKLQAQIRPIADMLVPVFFVMVGAKTNFGVLNPAVPSNREGLVIATFLIAVAIIGKVVTGFTVFGRGPGINRLAIGVGMIPRGEVGLVFASVGTASGALSSALEAGIVAMVILTTFLAPPLLRWVFNTPIAAITPEAPTAGESGPGA